MIKVCFRELNNSWDALDNLASQKMPAGGFRRNLARIYEQCLRERQSFDRELTDLLLEFGGLLVGQAGSKQSWQLPQMESDREKSFKERLDSLYSAEIEIHGVLIKAAEIESYQIVLSPVEEILLSKWLIEGEDFPSEIEQKLEINK